MGDAVVERPKFTQEEIFARLIELGKNAEVKYPHTIWAVSDPNGPSLFDHDKSDIDIICYSFPVDHFEAFPFNLANLENDHVLFYREKEYALEDAAARLAKIGRRCRFCHGVVHAATACQYSEHFVVCGRCIRPSIDSMFKIKREGLAPYLEGWTASKSSKKLKAKFPEAKGFYESAGLFLGKDNRKVSI